MKVVCTDWHTQPEDFAQENEALILRVQEQARQIARLEATVSALRQGDPEPPPEEVRRISFKEIDAELSHLELCRCSRNKHNIKKKGGNAWSGGSIRVDQVDDQIWLSTFPIKKAHLKPGHKYYAEVNEGLNRLHNVTAKWDVGVKGIDDERLSWGRQSRSINVTLMSPNKFRSIVVRCQKSAP
jgi:hypothetical protein